MIFDPIPKIVGIVGSRSFTDYELFKKKLNELNIEILFVNSGGAPGTDKMAIRWAKENNKPYKEYLADWDNLNVPNVRLKINKFGKKYNANAGHDRNELIVVNSEIIIAFLKGNTPGTLDTIKRTKRYKKELITIKV